MRFFTKKSANPLAVVGIILGTFMFGACDIQEKKEVGRLKNYAEASELYFHIFSDKNCNGRYSPPLQELLLLRMAALASTPDELKTVIRAAYPLCDDAENEAILKMAEMYHK